MQCFPFTGLNAYNSVRKTSMNLFAKTQLLSECLVLLKPASLATEPSWNIDFYVACCALILTRYQITMRRSGHAHAQAYLRFCCCKATKLLFLRGGPYTVAK